MARWNVLLLLIVFFSLLAGHALPAEPPPKPPARTDHYGDPLPAGARFRLGTVRLRHDGDVMALAWLPDGRTLASAGWDRTVRLWQIPGGKQFAKWDNLEGVVFSPDGRSLACGEGIYEEENRSIRIIDVATGKERRRIRLPKNSGALFNLTPGYPTGFYSPDAKLLALRGGAVYDVDNGKQLRALNEKVFDFGRPILFTPDSRSLLVAMDKGAFRWTIRTGMKEMLLQDLDHFPHSFAFSHDGKMLAAIVSDGSITLRSWPAGKELHRLQINEDPGLIDSGDHDVLAFSPDGKFLATGTGAIRLWNPATGERLRRLEGHWGDYVHDLAFSPDSSLLASAGADGAVIVWEVRAGKSPRPLTGVGHWLELVGLATDGQTLLTRSAEGTLTVWDVRDGRRVRTLASGEGSADSFLFGPDAGRKRMRFQQEMEKGHQPALARQRIGCSTFSPDHSMMAVGNSADGRILLLRKTANGIEHCRLDDDAPVQQARRGGYNVSVSQLTFAPDGRTLVATYSDGRLILWNPRTGRLRYRLSLPRHGGSYRCLEFSSDGRLLALSDRHGLYLVETATGQQFRERLLGQDWIDSLAFVPDNRTLVLGDAGSPAAIRLWDLLTDKQIDTLQGHRSGISKFVFSPDGAFLFSGSDDNTVLCWDVAALLHRRPSSKELTVAQWTLLWTDLASKDAPCAQKAVGELIQAGDAVLPFLEKVLPPVPPAQMARIFRLIADLDHEQFNRREEASRELKKSGESAASALREALKAKPSLEVRKRILAILDILDQQPPSREELRAIRALQVLESVGTLKTKQFLEGLAQGAGKARLTEEARASLQRLIRRKATGP